jgi:N-acetyl-alpha-D-muramate 1-phosphate uridylyltransferase
MSSCPPDKAMVFAAGLGTRMQPLTDAVPKPLIKVAGKALIDHTLDRLRCAGIATAIVNVHYQAKKIEAHLLERQVPRIIVSDESDKLLGQGGGIAKALPLLGNTPFFIANSDAFWIEGPASNLRRLAKYWNPDKMDILLLVAAAAASIGVGSCGDFHLTQEGKLRRRVEREVAAFVYTGVGIMKPELFAGRTVEVFPLSPLFSEAADRGRLYGQRLDGLWFHVGTPEALGEAEQKLGRANT